MRLGHQLRVLRAQLMAQGDVVLTFDLGDLLDRVRPETEASMGMVNVDLMASLGVDGWIFGNNEGLTIPTEDWPLITERANTIVFGTNLKWGDGQAFDFFQDYHIYERNHLRIGVFGVTPNYQIPYGMLGVDAGDPFVRAAEITKILRQRQCDVIVCLSHLGLRSDRKLAKCAPDIQVILGGHTHEFMSDLEWAGDTAIFQPGKHARVFGQTTLTLNDMGDVTNVRSKAIPVHLQTPQDEAMQMTYQRHLPSVRNVLSRIVATIPKRLAVVYERESTFPNLLADVLYDEFSGDLAMMMTGALNASVLPGQMQLEHLLGACPTPTRPIVVSLTGQDLYDIFEQGIQAETYARHGIGFGFRGGQIGYLIISGATITLSGAASGERHVKEICIAGRPVRLEQVYRVITCEYLWLSPVFAPFRRARDITYQKPLVREVLVARLGESGRLARAQVPRYTEAEDGQGGASDGAVKQT